MEVTGWTTVASSSTYTWNSTAEIEQQLREEDEAMTLTQAEIHPVVPKKGAYVRVIPEEGETQTTLHRFGQWRDDGMFDFVDETSEGRDPAKFEALIPAVYGLGYERATGLPQSGYAATSLVINGWRGIETIVRLPSRSSSTAMMANHVAGLAPMLNPATEKPKDAIARLQREKEQIEFSLRARMVAEGVARNWCSEFDPILDATGLAPRKNKGWIEGTATFRMELTGYDLTDPDVIQMIKDAPQSYINNSAYKVVDITVDPYTNSPMLST